MNIFENYLKKINKIILENKVFLNLENIESLTNVNLESPPEPFNYDLSTNVCLVLAKAKRRSVRRSIDPVRRSHQSHRHEETRGLPREAVRAEDEVEVVAFPAEH